MQMNFVHPLDSALSNKILNSEIGEKCLNAIFTNNLDQVNNYLYSTSCMRLDETSRVYQYMLEGCSMFEVSTPPNMYVTRSYFYDVKCTGMEMPIIVIPNLLLKRDDQDILRGRVMAAVGAIKAGHHKLTFISWIYDNFSSLIDVPFLPLIIRAIKNEWYRSQFFTLDRAFYLATLDKALTLKNILYGQTSFEMFDLLSFGNNDSFLRQMEEFNALTDTIDVLSLINSYLHEESWLPERYSQIKDFWEEKKICLR